MSQRCGRSSPERSDLYKEQSKAADGKCFCFNAQSGNSKYFNQHKDKQHKIRRLKTRKERYQKAGKGTSKNKAHLRDCFCQSRKDLTFFPNCCQCRHLPTRKKTPISSAPLVTQEPSIITDSRLTGHHGLFNHEVKSIDIERLLRKNCLLQREQNTEEVKDYSSNLSPTTCSPVLLSSDGLLGANVEGCMASKKKVNATTKTHDDSQDIETINLQSSNKETVVTPGVLQLHSSSESRKSLNQSKDSIQTTKTKSTDKCLSGMNEAFYRKPFDNRDKINTLNRTANEMICDQKQLYKNQDTQTRENDLILSPFGQVPSLSDKDPDLILKTTHVLAARLSESLHLPVSIRRNPLSESKEVLLKSLQERHGPCLQENLKELQRSLGFLIEPSKATLEKEKDVMGEDYLFSTDTSLKTTGSENFCRKSSSQSRHSLQLVAEEVANPADSFVNILDETFRPDYSPRVFMDFEPSGTSVNDLFTHYQILPKGENVSRPECWEETKSKTQESAMHNSFQSQFLNQSWKSRQWISEQQPHHSKVQHFFPYQDRHLAAMQQDGHLADTQLFPQEQNESETDRFYSAPVYQSKSHSRPQNNLLQTFGQLSPFHPNFRSNPADMMDYPPSHMLEKSLAPRSSSLHSPEHWSFPPMRLY
ncbi:uncharacterized protein si:dkey-250k15.4 [Cyprinodon tularosa]|uniref:uncharacterized protein si:dkey-250k15.4 n=1 Tax=Cyprinodon tularosa TaxID=77115 RepID=UPI0018E24FE4|nr:uncharacterized protein si:dkey-250k15.4 [Cyprinodon tularosa]